MRCSGDALRQPFRFTPALSSLAWVTRGCRPNEERVTTAAKGTRWEGLRQPPAETFTSIGPSRYELRPREVIRVEWVF